MRVVFLVLCLLLLSGPALALRPYDSTDADVAKQGEFELEPDLFLGAILEGPYSWAVRPVAEVFGEQASGSPRITSGLVGAIWRFRDGLSFDVGIRRAHDGDQTIRELRLGLTLTFG